MTKNIRGSVECNHCGKKWKTQQGSTSNLKNHIINNYFEKLSEADRESLTTLGQSSGKKGGREYPQRCMIKKSFENAKVLPRARLKSPDRLLAKYIVNSSTSMHIVDDCDFSRFCKSLKPQ